MELCGKIVYILGYVESEKGDGPCPGIYYWPREIHMRRFYSIGVYLFGKLELVNDCAPKECCFREKID